MGAGSVQSSNGARCGGRSECVGAGVDKRGQPCSRKRAETVQGDGRMAPCLDSFRGVLPTRETAL